MREEMEKVMEFHTKHRFNDSILLPMFRSNGVYLGRNALLGRIANSIAMLGKVELSNLALEAQKSGDERLYRAYLLIEELSEVIEALASNDLVTLADGLGDLLYVLLGTAITYRIPLKEVFQEIHDSNMTKRTRDPIHDPRMRDKGPNYKRPDIHRILKEMSNVDS